MRRISMLLPAAALLLLPVAGHGAGQGFYIGLGVGSASFEDDFDVDIDDIDDDDVGYKLFGGYRATPNLAVEGGYRDFGKAETGDGANRVEIKSKGWGLYGMLIAPVGIVDLFAKGGVVYVDTDRDAGGIDLGDNDTSFAWGLGGTVNFGAFGLRLEYESFEVDVPDKLWMITLSGMFSFGGR